MKHKVELVVLLLYGRNIFFFIHRKRESVSKIKQEKKTLLLGVVFFLFFSFFGMCVLCLFNTVCSVFSVSCWQFSGAQKVPVLSVREASSIRWICRLLPRDRKNLNFL